MKGDNILNLIQSVFVGDPPIILAKNITRNYGNIGTKKPKEY